MYFADLPDAANRHTQSEFLHRTARAAHGNGFQDACAGMQKRTRDQFQFESCQYESPGSSSHYAPPVGTPVTPITPPRPQSVMQWPRLSLGFSADDAAKFASGLKVHISLP